MGRPEGLVLLHLSDIHLKKEELESQQDLNADIRAKLSDDLRGADVPVSDGIDGILVTGDLAYAARHEEYQSAHAWLRDLCEQLKCEPSHVWVVPGNHDVDRQITRKSFAISDAHKVVRGDSDPSKALTDRLRDGSWAQLIFQPFAEFNSFAKSYTSETSPGGVAWESRALVLNDGTPLVLHGLNSALLSDDQDDHGRPCQVVGLKQVQLADGDGGVHVTLCHHPPDWLYDQDAVEDHLNNRARIQLYGHKHRQRVRKIDESTIVIAAGALHPDRNEGEWDPRYNLLRLSVRNGTTRALHVEVFERAWDKERTRFGRRSGGPAEYPRCFTLPIGAVGPGSPPTSTPPAPLAVLESNEVAATAQTEIDDRKIVYDFFELSFAVRMRVIVRLGLMRDDDVDAADAELVRRALRRAREEGNLQALRDAIDEELRKQQQ